MAEKPQQDSDVLDDSEGYASGVLIEDPLGSEAPVFNESDLSLDPIEAAKRRRIVREARRTVRESEEQNTIDSKEEIVLIDAHAHLGGKSLSGATELRGLTRGVGRGTIASFLYYNAAPDQVLVEKLVKSLSHFCRDESFYRGNENPIVGAVGLVLDLGFVAMKAITTTNISRTGAAFKKRERELATEYQTDDFGRPDYRAERIYHPVYYTFENDADSSKKEYIWYPRDDASWNAALDKVAEACKRRPGQVWAFVGFDPRRSTGVRIAKARLDSGAFVGVKLYSRTGWMPIHNRCLYGDEVGDPLDTRCDELYTYLTANDIPVLVHCSPTGFPPDDFLVLPWSCTKFRLRKVGFARTPAFVQTTNVASPKGYGTIPDVLWPPTYEGESPYKRMSKTDEVLAIRDAASFLGNYSVYMQMTTSPYSWEPVLAKHPTLRLCLAHFGAEVGVYATPSRNVPYDSKWQEVLELHPYVAGATFPYPRDRRLSRDFTTLFKNGVLRLIRTKCKKTAERAERLIWTEQFFENDQDWSRWFSKWNTAYPVSWHEKVLELIANPTYVNLYTDVAYLTTRRDKFKGVFRPVVDQALAGADAKGKALRSKLMIGTDWFMIEMQSFSPRDFWKMVMDGFLPDFAELERPHTKRMVLWMLWSLINALRWLNLQPRYNQAGMQKLQNFYFAGKSEQQLPAWWRNLRKFYEQQKHLVKDEAMVRYDG